MKTVLNYKHVIYDVHWLETHDKMIWEIKELNFKLAYTAVLRIMYNYLVTRTRMTNTG